MYFVHFKGDITHSFTQSHVNLESTYRVVLHPSYLQKVFSLIIFIKERNSFTILSEKRLSGGAPWAKLKSYGHLSVDRQQNRDI